MGLYYDVWGRIPFITTLLICITTIFYVLCAFSEVILFPNTKF